MDLAAIPVPPIQPVFYGALLRVHAVITRGLAITHTNGLVFAQNGFPDTNTFIGFSRYAQSLLVVMENHHHTEEEITFPYFQNRLPSLRIEPIIEQHKQMRPHIVEMKAAIENIAADSSPSTVLEQFTQACGNLRILWGMHAPAEENYFGNNSLSALELSEKEQIEITRRTAEHNQKYSHPPQWIVPFILYNLPPDEREIMAQFMPPHLTKVLMPMLWKNEWAPMKPFLLE